MPQNHIESYSFNFIDADTFHSFVTIFNTDLMIFSPDVYSQKY